MHYVILWFVTLKQGALAKRSAIASLLKSSLAILTSSFNSSLLRCKNIVRCLE